MAIPECSGDQEAEQHEQVQDAERSRGGLTRAARHQITAQVESSPRLFDHHERAAHNHAHCQRRADDSQPAVKEASVTSDENDLNEEQQQPRR